MDWDDIGVAATLLALGLSIVFFVLATRASRAQQEILDDTRDAVNQAREALDETQSALAELTGILSDYRKELDGVRQTSTLRGLLQHRLLEGRSDGRPVRLSDLEAAAVTGNRSSWEVRQELRELRIEQILHWKGELGPDSEIWPGPG